MVILPVFVAVGDFRERVVLMEGASVQSYIDGMAGNSQVLKVAAGDVIAGFVAVIAFVVNRHACDDAVSGQHVRHVHAFQYRPGMGGVDVMAIVIASPYLGVGFAEGNQTIDLVAGDPL